MNDVGLHADWQVIKGADEFFNVTKAMHNSLQGMYYDWTPAMREIWLNYNQLNAELFDESYDFVVIHDPQPAAILTFLEERHRPHATGSGSGAATSTSPTRRCRCGTSCARTSSATTAPSSRCRTT